MTTALDLDRLVTRDRLPIVAMELGWTQGVEIGTYRGEFARHLMVHWSGHLRTVDPWINQPDSDYLDGCNRQDMDAVMEEAIATLRPWINSGQCEIMRMTSALAASRVPDESIDFVFVDGNHAYPAALDDYKVWWPKLKVGGLLGAHDFYTRNDAFQRANVADAFLDFLEVVMERPYRPRITPCSSAWAIKEA